jgi:hypothetical protein
MRSRIPTLSVYASLILVFVCAWFSDRWPNLALATIVVAAVIIAAQVALLVVHERSSSRRAADQSASPSCGESSATQAEKAPSQSATRVTMGSHAQSADLAAYLMSDARYLASTIDYLQWAQQLQWSRLAMPTMRGVRVQGSDVFSWGIKDVKNEAAQEILMAGAIRRRLTTGASELEKWKFIEYDQDIFDVFAGAFMIEHFRGKTVIRVADSKNVTVENEPAFLSRPSDAVELYTLVRDAIANGNRAELADLLASKHIPREVIDQLLIDLHNVLPGYDISARYEDVRLEQTPI